MGTFRRFEKWPSWRWREGRDLVQKIEEMGCILIVRAALARITTMGTWNAFYIRQSAGDEVMVETIRAKFPRVELEAGNEYWGVTLSADEFRPPERELKEISSRLKTDVMWLSFQSAVDAFQFHHWRSGQLVRSLIYGCEREGVWERVDGTSEPWEREVLFDQKRLKVLLKSAGTATAKRELQRIWREAQLATGRTQPALNSRACANRIAEHYHLEL